MKRANMPPEADTDFAHSQTYRAQKRSRSRQSTIEPENYRPATAPSRGSHHPRSRGSTASIQSSTTQYIPDQHRVPEGYEAFSRPQLAPTPNPYNGNPEEMIIRFGDQLANSHPGSLLDPALQENHNSVRPRPDINFTGHQYHSNEHLIPNGVPGGPHPNAHPVLFEGMENQIPDHLTEDNDGVSESGPKKRKGATSSIANDKELRRLLRQYDGYNLQQMAAEVQKHEGAGGKSEKVKQVFAMIWLRENCRKCTGSVRRDRVYCCYAEKCGTERVSVLNPASFGKLVRIIFPNVQTRRLGVRGESKYHYVDLTIVDQGPKQEQEMREQSEGKTSNVCKSGLAAPLSQEKSHTSEQQSNAQPQKFLPPTTTNILTERRDTSSRTDCECTPPDQSKRTSLPTSDARNMDAQQRLRSILNLGPTTSPAVENSSLVLPDIHEYLPANYDSDVADALAALYRSHCISVIDSFRFCREKTLFRNFSAFQGTLTVPVNKLMVHPEIAPWIEECDWFMYQKMVAFVAPLSTQMIPGQVLKAFRHISENLVNHLSETFKTHPEHVAAARLVPAQLFCHLLTRMLDANQSANAAAAWLCSAENRTQMWQDFKSFVVPIDLVAKAGIPRCSVPETMNILQERLGQLLSPLINQDSGQLQLFESDSGLPVNNSEDYPEFPDRWIAFILDLPRLFPGHQTQCIIDKIDALWTTALHRLTLGGCQSFSAWWMTKVFFLEMVHWYAELGGFMTATPKTLRLFSRHANANTNKRPSGAVDSATMSTADPQSSTVSPEYQQKPADSMNISPPAPGTRTNSHPDMKHAAREKDTMTPINHSPLNHDDSAIDLNDDSLLLSAGKYGDMMASDPADAEGDVVVV